MSDTRPDDAPRDLDPHELAILKLAIRLGLYAPDPQAIVDALLDDLSSLDERHP